MEKFLKSSALEIEVDNEVTESGRYSPRFVDEINDEIDLIEDKKDSIFSKCFCPLYSRHLPDKINKHILNGLLIKFHTFFCILLISSMFF